MVVKVYVSNIAPFAWSRERQMEVLRDVWDDTSGFEDVISGAARKAKRASDLKDRRNLLTMFRAEAKDELHVASLACLCFDDRDFLAVIAEMDKAGVTIVDRHSGLRIEPKLRPWLLKEARDAMETARRGDHTKSATDAAIELRQQRTLERIALIRDDWPKRDYRTTDLLKRAGERGHPMAYVTAKSHLGARPQRQRDYENEQAREAARAASRAKRAAAKAREPK